MIQPLGGEYAGTRELLASVPFADGYGVEVGLLIDTYDRYGLCGIGQVNLGVRVHRNRPLAQLAVMSRQITATLLRRCGIDDSGVGLTQYVPEPDGTFTPHTVPLGDDERPAVIQVAVCPPAPVVEPAPPIVESTPTVAPPVALRQAQEPASDQK